MSDVQISDDDVRSLAEKLASFCDQLEPGERAAFEYVEQYLAAVADGDADIEGYLFVVEDETTGALGVAAVEETSATDTSTTTDRATLWRTVLTNLTGA